MKEYQLGEDKLTEIEVKKMINTQLNKVLSKKTRVNKVIDIFQKDFNRVLDIGCYTGTFLQILYQLNPNVKLLYGIDCYEPAVNICKDFVANDIFKFKLHDCGKLAFEDKSFDVVTFFEVLEHVRDVDSFLKEVNRVLMIDGLVYLSVPNASWWRNIIKDILINKYKYKNNIENWPEYTPDQRDHINNYNFIHLYRILNLNGFKLEVIDYYDQSNICLFKLPYIKNLSSNIIMKLKKEKDVLGKTS